MAETFDAKGEAKRLRDQVSTFATWNGAIQMVHVTEDFESTLTKAEQAGFRRGVEAAARVVWCPPTCPGDCDAEKIRKLGEK